MIFFRQVNCGGCAPCPTGPCESSVAPTSDLTVRTSSASLSKCGFEEWPGYESTPPKYYLGMNLSGTITFTLYVTSTPSCETCLTATQWTFSGSSTYNDLTCSSTGSRIQAVEDFTDCVTGQGVTTYVVGDVSAIDANTFTESYTSITHSVIGTDTCFGSPANAKGTGAAYAVLADEYTTAELLTNVTNAVPTFTGGWAPYVVTADFAYYDLSADEVTATKTKIEYRFELPDLTGFTCYKITWAEKFVPESGSTTYTNYSYVWNGSATFAGPYTINPPTTQGQTTVVSVAVTCSGC